MAVRLRSKTTTSVPDVQNGGNEDSFGSPRPRFGEAGPPQFDPRRFPMPGERMIPDAGLPTEYVEGILDVAEEGSGLLRSIFGLGEAKNVYISLSQIRRFGLRPGDVVGGQARAPKENERYWGLLKVEKVNSHPVEEATDRPSFESMTPIHPNEQIRLETTADKLTTRVIDLVAPIGFGQRGLIVSSPKAGKTTMLKDLAAGIAENYPDLPTQAGVHLMAVLIGERPEEVTDITQHIAGVTGGKGEVASSNFDEAPEDQTRIAELALEHAKRIVETGRKVVVLLDSITRLARAYNLALPTSGRTLTGGFDPVALYPAKKFFGAARNFVPLREKDKISPSLTIIGTALVDTGSRMDDLIYEEFKGTGNMELHLDRRLADRRVFPAINITLSGTRQEELLYGTDIYPKIVTMRRMVDLISEQERTETFLERLKRTKNNKEFLETLSKG